MRFHADYRQEVQTALRIAEEYKVPFVLAGAGEAWDAVPELARRKVPVLLRPGTSFREESPERHPHYTARLAALLLEAGVPFAFYSGSGGDVALLRSRVALSLRFGLPAEAALEALTLGAARILGVDGAAGSIEPGKAADLVAIEGEPLDVAAPVTWVMVRGQVASGEPEREL